jgi:hypothetical protein
MPSRCESLGLKPNAAAQARATGETLTHDKNHALSPVACSDLLGAVRLLR